ncbi:MAG: hypothetical protein EXS35_05240 [Pedosphaera sp.]|nr:hypothetical protein [Pedosphaera sp.]
MNGENLPNAGAPVEAGAPALPLAEPPLPVPPILPEKIRSIGRWRWWIHLLVIGSYPLLLSLASVGAIERDGPALSGSAKGLLFVCGAELLIFGVIFALGWLASRASRDELLLRWRPGFWVVPLGVGYSIAIRLAAGVVAVAVMLVVMATGKVSSDSIEQFTLDNRPQVETIVDVPAMKSSPAYFWLTITLVSFVVAGLREELWRSGFLAGMRALWPRAFGSRFGQIGAVAIGAVIFGLGHLPM